MPKTLSLLAVLKKIDTKGLKSLSDPQWNTFLASDTEPNEIEEKIKKLEGIEEKGGAYDATGDLIPEDNQAMIDRFKKKTGRASGRESLKVKKSKIDVKSFKEKFLDKDEEPVKPDVTGTSDLATIDKPPDLSKADPVEEKETEGLKGIRDVLDDILKVLRLDFKGDRKEARDAQKEAAKDKRDKRESKLEGGVKKSLGVIGNAVGAMMKPFEKEWSAIINWIKFTLIGVLFQKTLKWFSDPKNKKKAERIGKFFKDWWPALAASAALFLTPLGALIAGMTGLLRAIIPKLVMAIAANPWAAAAVLGSVAIWGISKRIGGKDKSEGEEGEEGEDGSEEFDTTVAAHGGGLIESPPIQNYNEGGVVQSPPIQNYNEGGVVQQFKPEKSGGFKMGSFFAGGGLVQHLNNGGLGASSLGSHSINRDEEGNLEKVSQVGGIEESEFTSADGSFTEKTRTDTSGGGLEETSTSTSRNTITEEDGTVTTFEEKKKMREQIASIGVPDLLEHQDQLLSEIQKLEGFENVTIDQVINQQTGIPQEKLLPILLRSDAQKATSDKHDKAHQEDMKARGIKPGGGHNISANDEVGRSLAGTTGYRMGQVNPPQLVSSSTTFESESTERRKKSGAEMAGGGLVQGFNKGGEVPGSGNKDTVPAMLTPGEFVMSKGAVQKYGSDTMEGLNAAAGVSAKGGKGDTVPSMLTPGEFVVSAPAVQQFGVKTLESMNLKGGGNNKPELKATDESVTANKGGLIRQYLQGGGEVKPQGWKRWFAGAADVMTGGLTDFDQRGSIMDGAKRLVSKEPLETPLSSGENKVVTLPPIRKATQELIPAKSDNDVPNFRIPIISDHRSMVIATLGIQDLVGGV